MNQAANAFKEQLPESSPVNLVTEKDRDGRVYVCTYQTMMGLIRERDGEAARFGVGHFDWALYRGATCAWDEEDPCAGSELECVLRTSENCEAVFPDPAGGAEI